jgi:hypothetical protein
MTMGQMLDSGHEIEFGQSLQELELVFSSKAINARVPPFRRDIDKTITLKNVVLSFDHDKLTTIEFQYPYGYTYPPTPYPEMWKNLANIGGQKIFQETSRSCFVTYLDAWQARANSLGIFKTEFGEMSAQQFSLAFEQNEFRDMVQINMGPTRRTGGKGLWCDGWTARFSRGQVRVPKIPAEMLVSLTAFCDDFNTIARQR